MSRLIIALDTATEAIGLGVARIDDGVLTRVHSRTEIAPRRANSRLLEALTELLAEAGERIDEVGGVIVGRGPGSFTGVRIGVATAKGLAQGLGAPLVGVSSLDAIAWRMTAEDGLVAVVGDAMRQEVYPALFRVAGGSVTRITADTVAKPADVAAQWAQQLEEPVRLTGNGLAKYADSFTEALGSRATLAAEDQWWPSGTGLLAAFLAAGGDIQFAAGDPGAVLPVYTRMSDAEEAERARAGGGA